MIVLWTTPRDLDSDSLRDSKEVHFGNIRQLTFGGTNAEAYFSSDGTKLVFQSTR
ncbi:MAG: PD40 domain-containing protein, partial [Proteobacteria bacterium]|nr:PD40 domain-containing protein [Pseudomonadota bacterium]